MSSSATQTRPIIGINTYYFSHVKVICEIGYHFKSDILHDYHRYYYKLTCKYILCNGTYSDSDVFYKSDMGESLLVDSLNRCLSMLKDVKDQSHYEDRFLSWASGYFESPFVKLGALR